MSYLYRHSRRINLDLYSWKANVALGPNCIESESVSWLLAFLCTDLRGKYWLGERAPTLARPLRVLRRD